VPNCAPHLSRILLGFAVAAGVIATLSCDLPNEIDDPGSQGPAATCFDYGQQLLVVSSIPVGGAGEIAVIDHCAYVAAESLNIIALDAEGQPIEIDGVPIRASRLAAAGEVLCTTLYDRLSIVDATPGHRGEEIGKLSLPFGIQDLSADDRYAYLLSYEHGLWIVDIGDPSAPRISGSVDIPVTVPFPQSANPLAVRGNLACAIFAQELWVIDVSNRSSPQRMGHLAIEEYPEAVAMVDHYAVTLAGRKITVVDIGNPAAPHVVLTTDMSGTYARNIVFAGTRAYVCGGDVVIIDLSRPTSPVVAGRLSGVDARTIAVDGERMFLGRYEGLLVAKLPSTRRPAPLLWVNAQGDAFRTALKPPIACVAGGFRGLWVMDIEGNPGVVARLDFDGAVHDVVCDSAYAYVAAGRSGLAVVEAGVDLPPRVIGQLGLPSESLAIALDGHRAYLAQGDMGLWIADVSDPRAPRVLGSLDTDGAVDLVIRDGRAWIADTFGLVVADVTDPEHPRFRTGIEVPEANALTLEGNDAYVVSERGRLQVIDISAPDAPKLAGYLEFPSAMRDVAIDGDYAYLATEMGLMVADISDPDEPVLVGMAYDGLTSGVLVDEASNRLYVANGNLTVIRRQCDVERGVWR
jgi:hypothetical protein